MLRRLRISNYRSLGRNIALGFGRISVLIGPNGSGKSNALDALSFIRDAVLQGLPAAITHREGIDSIRRHSGGHPYNVSISLEMVIENEPATYALQITGDRTEELRRTRCGAGGVLRQSGACGPFPRRPRSGGPGLSASFGAPYRLTGRGPDAAHESGAGRDTNVGLARDYRKPPTPSGTQTAPESSHLLSVSWRRSVPSARIAKISP